MESMPVVGHRVRVVEHVSASARFGCRFGLALRSGPGPFTQGQPHAVGGSTGLEAGRPSERTGPHVQLVFFDPVKRTPRQRAAASQESRGRAGAPPSHPPQAYRRPRVFFHTSRHRIDSLIRRNPLTPSAPYRTPVPIHARRKNPRPRPRVPSFSYLRRNPVPPIRRLRSPALP